MASSSSKSLLNLFVHAPSIVATVDHALGAIDPKAMAVVHHGPLQGSVAIHERHLLRFGGKCKRQRQSCSCGDGEQARKRTRHHHDLAMTDPAGIP